MRNIVYFFVAIFIFSCQPKNDWISLFDGETLDGWHIYGGSTDFNGWTTQQGILLYNPSLRTNPQSANLVTDETYESFELSLEWMIAENGNSGLFWSVFESADYEHPYQTGPEIQILDDNWSEYIEERGDINRAGSLYGIMPPSEIVSKPSGEWNKYILQIDHTKNEGWLLFNEVKVLEFPVHGPKWEAMINNSSFAGWPDFGLNKKGHISLQDYGGKVAFREIKIRELK